MTTPTPTPTQRPALPPMDPAEWYTKDAAAARMGISARRVLDLAQEGKLRWRRERDPASGQKTKLVSVKSVERYMAGRPEEPEESGPQTLVTKPGSGKTEFLELIRLLRRNEDRTPAHLWLTLQEAADFSGLPAAVLLDLIGRGHLPAVDIGRRRGGRYRIRQIDIRNLDACSFQPVKQLPGDLK